MKIFPPTQNLNPLLPSTLFSLHSRHILNKKKNLKPKPKNQTHLPASSLSVSSNIYHIIEKKNSSLISPIIANHIFNLIRCFSPSIHHLLKQKKMSRVCLLKESNCTILFTGSIYARITLILLITAKI